MKILILGGTGAIGEHLVKLLKDDNIEIYVTSRKIHDSFGSVHYIQGDAHDTTFITNLLAENFDVIVDFMIYTTSEFSKKISQYLAHTNQYVFLSSARVYANTEEPLTEDSPRLLDVCQDHDYLATDEYALTKARQEDYLFNSGKTNWTIIRPYITYSEIRLQLGVLEKEDWLYRALAGHTVVFPEDMFNKTTTLTYGFNVAQAIKAIIGKEKAFGQAFHITHSQPVKWTTVWDVYSTVIFEHTGHNPKIKLCTMNEFEKIHKGHYQIHFDRMFNRIFNNQKINQFIDTSLFLKPDQGLRMCFDKFITSNKTVKPYSYRSEGRKDFLTNEYWCIFDVQGLENKIKYFIGRLGF